MRIKLSIEYDGSEYVGWQRQKNGQSIQEEIEKSLKKLFKMKIQIFVAGRTDAGVHAKKQVAHFDIESKITPDKIKTALNFYLKESFNKISIVDSVEVEKYFHSRFSAKEKVYSYKILNRKSPSPLREMRVWYIPYKLDVELMQSSSDYLIGMHDFNSFRSTQCQAKSSVRSIKDISIVRINEEIIVNITAKSFLHNQVRIIVGSLVNVGRKYWKKEKIKEILEQRNRIFAGPTAPPEGLYLENIEY